MYHQCYFVRFFFIFLLLSTGIANTVTAQTIDMWVQNTTTGGDGSTANRGDWMRYRTTVTNNTSTNISSSTVYTAIPAGTSYVAGTTKVNGAKVSDVNGQMPFRAGGLVNSASSSAGTVAPGATAVVEYFVQVNTNTGALYNTAALQAKNSSGSTITVNSNTSQTNMILDQGCNQVYESTSNAQYQGGTSLYPYSNIKVIDNYNGTAYKTVFFGTTGPCYDNTGATLRTGSVLTDAEAMAYDNITGRIYFINGTSNNPAQDLCYIDQIYNGTSVAAAVRFTNTPLETNTGVGYNINRMTTGSDGFYALTANALDLIKFTVDRTTNIPTISRLGALINDAGNGANNVLAETGGDMFGDASGKLFLITGSCKVYRITPATRIATYIGTITGTGLPTSGTNSVAAVKDGYIYISGAYQKVYSADLATMTAVAVNSGSNNVWYNGDYASCILPVLSPALTVTKSYTGLNGSSVLSGEPVEFTITVTNTGNLNAGSVLLSDPIPAYAHYIANSTMVNGVAVADINGTMPFATSQLINSPGAPAGIIKPGDDNKLVIKFKVTTDPLQQICNQATVNFADNDGSPVIYSNDPSTPAGGDATCFWSDRALVANKTYNDLDRSNAIGVIVNDHIEYTIEVINTSSSDAGGVTLYDAIPAHAQYIANSTTINGVAVADIGGAMPYSLTGGSLINSPGALAGVINPGTTNKAVIKFRIISTGVNVNVCNQASVSMTTSIGNSIIYSDDPSQPGSQDQTCFISTGALCPECGRIATNNSLANNNADLQLNEGTLVKVQPNPFVKDLNVQVQLNTAEQIRVRLIDFYGRTVYTATRQLSAGYNSFHVDAPASLARGVYVLELLAGNNRLIQKKLIKQ